MDEKLKPDDIDQTLLEEVILEVDRMFRALEVQLTAQEKGRLAAALYRERTGHNGNKGGLS
jgi:hypothetical protein